MRYLAILTAGTGLDRNGARIRPSASREALAEIRAELAREHGGYTELEQVGGYFAFDTLVRESGVQFQVLLRPEYDAPNKADVEGHRLAHFVATKLNQQSVMLVITPVTASFVGT